MDPASAIIGIVAFSITVCEKINTLRKELKGAPRQVQTLQELCGVVELFLDRLQSVNVHEISYSAGEAAYLNVLCDRSQRCLEAVDKVVETIVARIPTRDSVVGLPAIRWRKWVSKKDDLEELSQQLSKVKDALGIMLDFMHS